MAEQISPRNTTLVFDWGGTLMKVFPQFTGPMASWPEVAVIDGAADALKSLHERWPMVVATNATDSDSPLVRQALSRAGLGDYFGAVFTSQEMEGAQKPELRFFRALENVLGRAPHQMVMVGDDYTKDILGAKAAGWRAVWYNPAYTPAAGSIPLHDAEIHDMRDLPAVLEQPALPDYAVSLAWLAGRATPFNILEHVNLVASAAYLMSLWLAQTGEQVNPILAHRGGVLHDLGKIDSIRAGKERGEHGDHAGMARSMLEELAQPELAQIADRHMIYADPDYPRRPLTWEQKVVNYADKLANGSRLVSVQERIEGLKARYPQEAASLETSMAALGPLQDEICERLHTTPEDLAGRLREALGLLHE